MKFKKKHLMIVFHIVWISFLILFIIGMYAYFRPVPVYPNINSTGHFKGNPDAKVKVVEFSDFQCPACSRALPIVDGIINKYGDNISFEYKHFPLTNIHRYAFKAAEASECASDQGKFWEMYEIMFENQESLAVSDLKGYAKELGLDTEKFDACLDSGAKEEVVKENLREAIMLDLPGTPTFLINGVMQDSFSYDELAKAIDAELQK